MKRMLSLLLAALTAAALCLPGLAAGLDSFQKVRDYTPGQFTDVPADSWCAANVQTVYEYGIMLGKTDTLFGADGSLTLATFGTFVPGHIDFGDDSGDGSWIYISGTDPTDSDTSTNYDTNESGWSAAEADPTAFAGIWYRSGDLDADSFIVIDSDGSWHLYQRAPGAENAEMDYGSIIPSDTEPYTYYAVSDPYGLSYRIFDYDTDEITWGEDNEYYDRLE